jgi:hypothetical protein
MIMLLISTYKSFCVASRQMNLDARVGAHPSDFCSGKSHQNHSLRDTTLRVPCVPRQSRRKKNSQLRGSNTFLLSPPLPAVLGGVQSQGVCFIYQSCRSPHRGRILRREDSALTNEFEQGGIFSLLARRASQSLTGEKRGVSERSELASACQGREAQSRRRPR